MTGNSSVEQAPIPTPGKDFPLRIRSQKFVDGTADRIVSRFPKLSPTGITIAGGALVVGGGKLIERENRRAERRPGVVAAGIVMQTAGVFLDVADGGIARARNRKKPNSVNTNRGKIWDVAVDRIEEEMLANERAKTARRKGSVVGEFAARGVQATTTLPSMAKLDRERRGVATAEVALNPVGILGSRWGRIGLVLVSEVYPKAQPVTDLIGTHANASEAVNRMTEKGVGVFPKEKRQNSVHAEAVLVGLQTVATAHAGREARRTVGRIIHSRRSRYQAGLS